ncbi:MAG TPA: CBS domain-containing protein [Rhizomicrobium sp.]|nr:CBS domain-containing protein [Rhizomicrobium sp.]
MNAQTVEMAMKVKDVMHKGATWVEASTPVANVARKMRSEDIGAIPVGEHDRLIGMVTDRDLCCRALGNRHDPKGLTARQVMSKPILYCREDDAIATAVSKMKKAKVRRLPVIDAKKRLVGMLSLGDLSAKVGKQTSAEALKALAAHHV